MTSKSFVLLADLAKKCKCDAAELLHLAAKGNLKLSIPFYGVSPQRQYFLNPTNPEVVVPEIPAQLPDSGVFDLHIQDVVALVTHGQIAVDAIFSPCSVWAVSYEPPRVVSIADIVIRPEEAASFKIAVDVSDPMSPSERSRLLRLIGAMAVLLAQKANKYTSGGHPNASQIADAVGELLDALPDANSLGLGNTNVRTTISSGIELLTTLQK